jgi:folate-binding protein YgfZ
MVHYGQHNTMISTSDYQTARDRVAAIERSDRGRIVVSGADRAEYLQGLLTNDIVALKSGEGCYAAYLTPQGRMIADLFVYELGDVILLTVPREQHRSVLEKLDQFIFSEDVQLGDASDTFSTTAIVGPDAARVVSQLTAIEPSDLAAMPEHGNRRGTFDDHPVIVVRVSDTGEPGYDMHVEAAHAAALGRALEKERVVFLEPDTADVLRVEAGVPRFGRDMDEETIPLEAGIESRAISFSKGCYVGQEVIIRVLHRGHGRVARKLVGLVFDGEAVPAPGTRAAVNGRDIGEVTSSAMSPMLKRPIALAYLHRDFLAPGTAVVVDGQTAAVSALPFVSRTS